ncbi:MAG: geranylgeranylglycerol-phosphate geranylgeranyltransferase [Chitinophagaceae bacterium]|nr:geranylgeranylglycerol-phosphate geranylgeranyltransferase [Chitinophagaceae bacterium]
MRLIAAFLRLVRWPNLVFIVLTQLLFYYCIYLALYKSHAGSSRIFWLIGASVSIAAAGYIINDYFDLNIDLINKPNKNVIDITISRRWAIVWHLFLSLFGIIATVIAVSLSKWYLVLANIACVALLWFYSTSLKCQVLIGNVIISLLTAWTVLIIFFSSVPLESALGTNDEAMVKFFRLAFLYAGFAFIISLIREAIKDIQDMNGDAQYGCKTLPLIAGVNATKIYTAVWLIVLIAVLLILQLYVLQFKWWLVVLYSLFLIISPLVYVLIQIFRAKSSQQFGRLSSVTKFIMFTGILSMIFFRIYF